jgi:hypothetical protein
MRAIALSILVLTCNLAACNQPAPPPPQKDAAAPGKVAASTEVLDTCPHAENGNTCSEAPAANAAQTHFGRPLQLANQEALATVAARVGDAAETVQVTGTVDAVCQKKGCWMILKDGDVTARVFTHAGDFYLPVDTNKGRKVVVEGELKAKQVSQKFAQHLEEDKGGDPSKVTGPQRELVLDATSLTLL